MALSDIISRREGEPVKILSPYCVQILCDRWIERDGNEVDGTRSIHCLNYWPGKLRKLDNVLVETDLTDVDEDIRNICEGLWTSTLKENWRQKLIDEQSINETTKVSGLDEFYIY